MQIAGLARTTAVRVPMIVVLASFLYIRFKPDLMPGDFTCSEGYEPAKGVFRFMQGVCSARPCWPTRSPNSPRAGRDLPVAA